MESIVHFMNLNQNIPQQAQNHQECKQIVINPYNYCYSDLECKINDYLHNISSIPQINSATNNNSPLQQNCSTRAPYTNQNMTVYYPSVGAKNSFANSELVIEIEKQYYRIDAVRRLRLLQCILTRNSLYILRLIMTGEQTFQEEEILILQEILLSRNSFNQVEIFIRQTSNSYDWNLLDILFNKQIGILHLRIEKCCQQTLRCLPQFKQNVIRILTRVHLTLLEDIPKSIFQLFAWPANLALTLSDNTEIPLSLEFLTGLKFLNLFEIFYSPSASPKNYSTFIHLSKQLSSMENVKKLSFSEDKWTHIDGYDSSDDTLISKSTQKEKYSVEMEFFRQLSRSSIMEITLTIHSSQIVQFCEIFSRQKVFVKLHIKIIPFLAQFAHSDKNNDDLSSLVNKFIPSEISIKNLVLIYEKSSNQSKKSDSSKCNASSTETYLDSLKSTQSIKLFSQFVILLLGCKVSAFQGSFDSIDENSLELLSQRIQKNSLLKQLTLSFRGSVEYNNDIISNFTAAHFTILSCIITQKSYQFFYELFLNLKKLEVVSLRIETVTIISQKFFTLSAPFVSIHLKQPLNFNQKMILFKNPNIKLYYNDSDTKRKTMFHNYYAHNRTQIISICLFQKLYAFILSRETFNASLLEL